MSRKYNSPHHSKEGRKLKATKTKHDIHEDPGKGAQPPMLVLRKTDNPERPPVEVGRPEYQLGPVFVPNKLMNGALSCTSVTRTRSYTERPPKVASINASLTGLLKRDSEACRTSRTDISSHFPTSEKTYLTKLPREEMKRFQKDSFLPRIDRPSKTNMSLGQRRSSIHSVSSFQQVHKRSPSSSETLKLPPAKSKPGNMVCKKIPSATNKTSPNSDSSTSSPKETLVPKPPSMAKTKPSRKHVRRTRERAT